MNAPKLRFEEFNEEWITEKVGDSTKILMCKRIFANDTYTAGEIPFYKIGTIGSTPDAYIKRNLFEQYKNKYNYPRKGEVLITCSGTVGKCVIFDGSDSYYQDSNIVWLDNPSKKITNDFLYYYISNVDWTKLNSTTIIRIYGDNLRNLKITYPSNNKEQDKITKVLALLDKKIELQSKKIEDLKLFKISMLDKFFNSKSQVSKSTMSKFGKCLTGKSKVDKIDINGSNYIMDMGTITSDGNIIKSKPTFCTNDMLSYGDLIIPKDDIGGGLIIGKSGFIDEDNKYILGDHVYLLKTSNINSLYLHYQINSRYINRLLKKKVTGSAQLGIKADNILNQEILVHDIDDQEYIANIMKKIDKKILLENKKNNKLNELKKGLMQSMFV